ncbi:toxic membrane protein [Escherichia coli K-12]|nr:toxic membrane protein [Escherichia coli K-12]
MKEKGYDATCHHTDCTVTHKFQRLLTVSLRGGAILPYPYSLN